MRRFACFFYFVLCFSSEFVFASAPSLSEIRQGMAEYQRTINSLSVVYKVRESVDWQFMGMEQKVAQQWTWMISGRKRLLKNDVSEGVGSTPFVRCWTSYDGAKEYMVYFHKNDDSLVRMIEVSPGETIDLVTGQHMASAFGWTNLDQKGKHSVISLLHRANHNTTVEDDAIDGIKYAKVRLGEVGQFTPDGPQHEAIVWFSPSNHFLPRRIAIVPVVSGTPNSKGAVELPTGSFPDFLDVLEYVQVPDLLFNRRLWVPRRFQRRALFSHEVTVETISVNESIPAATFEPEMPFGAEICQRESGSATSKTRYVGGDDGERVFLDRLSQKDKVDLKPVAESLTPVDASPSKGFSWTVFFGAGSLILLGLALVASWRRAR